MMITIIDGVILYQRATLLVLFNDTQMNSGFARGQVGRWARSAPTSLQEGLVVIKCPADPITQARNET